MRGCGLGGSRGKGEMRGEGGKVSRGQGRWGGGGRGTCNMLQFREERWVHGYTARRLVELSGEGGTASDATWSMCVSFFF